MRQPDQQDPRARPRLGPRLCVWGKVELEDLEKDLGMQSLDHVKLSTVRS